MVSRRTTLALLSGALTGGLAGCLDGRSGPTDPTDTPTATPTRTDWDDALDEVKSPPPDTTPADWPPPAWTSDWSHGVPVSHVVGLDAADDGLVITATDSDGPTVLLRLDPDSRSTVWDRQLDGHAIANSALDRGPVSRIWGVTPAADALLVVTGRPDQGWTALHAVESASGDDRWSLRRDRRLAIKGIHGGTAYVLGREFEETTTDHHHGTDTPTPVPLDATLLAVDLQDGSVRWTRDFTGVGDVAVAGHGVYVAVMHRLLGLDHAGQRRWSVSADSRGKAIRPGPDVVFFIARPEWDRSVVRGVTPTGDVGWTKGFPADEAVRHGSALYLAGDGLWKLRADGTVGWNTDGHAGRLTFPPAGDRVYVRTGRQADAVAAVSLADGNREWHFDPPLNNAWPEAASDGRLVAGGIGQVGDGDGQPLYRVNATDGTASARFLEADPGPVRILGNACYVGTGSYESGGQVLALPL